MATGEERLDHGADLPQLPIHIVTTASELPADFLEPSPQSELVIGFDCEGVDLCRDGALCVMQVKWFLMNAIQLLIGPESPGPFNRQLCAAHAYKVIIIVRYITCTLGMLPLRSIFSIFLISLG